MEQSKEFIIKVEGYDLRGQKDPNLLTQKPFLNQSTLDSLAEALATATTLPLEMLDKRLAKTRHTPFHLFRVTISRKDDSRSLLEIQHSKQSPLKDELKMTGVYLFTRQPRLVQELLKMDLDHLLYKPDQNGSFLLGYTAQVGNAYDLIHLEGFQKLKEQLKPFERTMQLGPADKPRRLPTKYTIHNDIPNLKKKFGP
ncbi:hypothetical protein ACQKLP_10870 [Chitinophaga sp. NPDC101104]|uniref:hypothetical protein n=1 Tax=Chitinophaga sp. NPDC101104 TaxID=3390561 RepID=UPI003CFBF549